MGSGVDWKEVHRFAYATEPRMVAEAVERGFKVAVPQGIPDGDDLYLRYPGCQWVSAQIKSTSAKTKTGLRVVGLISSRGGKTTGKYRGTVGLSGADFYLIRCKGLDGVYIIPTRDLPTSSHLCLSSRYDRYLNAWDLLKIPMEETNAKPTEQLVFNPAPDSRSDRLVLPGKDSTTPKQDRGNKDQRTGQRSRSKNGRTKEGVR